MKRTLITTILTILILFPFNLHAQEWKEFDLSAGDESNFKFADINITFKQGDYSMSPFKEDNLTMIIRKGQSAPIKQNIVSSYGRGKIVYEAGLLFIEYGVGRGTSVRTEKIKAFSFSGDLATPELVELCDIQRSYYVQSPKPSASPYKVEYHVKIVDRKKDVRLILQSNDKRFDLPERKEMIIDRVVHKQQ